MRSFVPLVLLAGLCLLMSPATLNAQVLEEDYVPSTLQGSGFPDESYVPPELTEPIIAEEFYTPPETAEQEYPCVQMPVDPVPPTEVPPATVNCCDIAHVLAGKRSTFDYLDDQIDEQQDTINLGLMLQQQILMRNPFTPLDQLAWEDISRVILTVNNEMEANQAEQDTLATEIVMLNQQLFMCYFVPDNSGPIAPVPDPGPAMP